MKKINLMAILIAAVLTLCFTFTSCGKDDEKENDIYTGVLNPIMPFIASNETDPNISITVTGKTLNINYLTVGGYMMTYTGIKD